MLEAVGQFMDTLRRRVNHLFEDTEASVLGWFKTARRRRRVRKTMPEPVSDVEHKRAARYLETGREYYNERHFKKALKYFRKATSTDGRYGLAYYYLGLALYKIDRPKGARSAWRRVVDIDPDSEAAEKAREKLGNTKLGKNRKVKVSGVDSDSSS